MQAVEAPINGMNLYAPRHCRTTVNHGQTPVEAEWILSEAATHAGLAVGVAQEGFFDVMTIEEAHAALDEMQEAHRPKRPH